MLSPDDSPFGEAPPPYSADRLPGDGEIVDVDIDWSGGPTHEMGALEVHIDGHYPGTTDLVTQLTPPVDGEYWLGYLDSGFVEAFIDVGERSLAPNAVRYEDDAGIHWLRRASPTLHHEWDDFATMLVTIVDDQTVRSAAMSVPDARTLLARHYNQTASIGSVGHDPVVLVEDESTDRTRWGVKSATTDEIAHELTPVWETEVWSDTGEWVTGDELLDEQDSSPENDPLRIPDDISISEVFTIDPDDVPDPDEIEFDGESLTSAAIRSISSQFEQLRSIAASEDDTPIEYERSISSDDDTDESQSPANRRRRSRRRRRRRR